MSADAASLTPGFELVEHTADVGVRAWGARREDVFVGAARGMLSMMCDTAAVQARERYRVEVEAPDIELLLAAWLNELLYLVEGRHLVLDGDFEVELCEPPAPDVGTGGAAPGAPCDSEGGGEGAQVMLRALAAGEPYDPARHAPRGAVKAATLHRLSVRRVPGGWEGRVLLDV